MLLITDVFHSLPWLYFSLVFLFSLMIGSFLNVVIHRLPIMLEREWQAEYLGYFNPETLPQQEERYNLMVPRSACPHCGHAITAMENIPLLSWLWLKGRCRECQAPISVRYQIGRAHV